MTDAPTATADSATPELATPELALASMAAAQLVLAKHRQEPFTALMDKLKAADLPSLAADIRAIIKLSYGETDRLLLGQRADILSDTPKFLTSMAEANAAMLKPSGG